MSGPTFISFSGSMLGGYEVNALAINGLAGVAALQLEMQSDSLAFDLYMDRRLNPKEKLRPSMRPPPDKRHPWGKIPTNNTRVK